MNSIHHWFNPLVPNTANLTKITVSKAKSKSGGNVPETPHAHSINNFRAIKIGTHPLLQQWV